MNGALMIRWKAPRPGREATSVEVFGSAINRFETLAKQGRIHGHREYFSVTGDFGGFALLEGELEELTKILTEEENLRLTNQANAVVTDYEIQAYVGGSDQTIQQQMANWQANLHDIGYL